MSKKDFSVIILAAGKGTRMKSPLPKVLHPVAGTPMLRRIIDEVKKVGPKEIRVVVGYSENLVRQVVEPLGVSCMQQIQQRGTADAVASAQVETLAGTVLILNGDHPLIRAEDIEHMVETYAQNKWDLAVVTCRLKKPGEFGRIVRHKGSLRAIVEAKDASAETLKINEVNTGIYLTSAETLQENLPKIKSHNKQNEFYFTDIVSLCQEEGDQLGTIEVPSRVAFGINSQAELAKATRHIFQRKAQQLMDSGVVLLDPKTTYVEDDVQIGEASVIYPNVFIRNGAKLGRFCVVESHCMISDCQIGDSVQIKAGCYLQDSQIGDKVQLGPYAHLRPGNQIGNEAKVGNFVEMKKTSFGERSKASHLTYLGDAIIGKDTNIGCGTITCNYAVDHKKYVTKIGDHVFVGSDTQFIAPVEIGDHSVIASGSTITKSVPAGALAVARGRQMIKENYQPKKAEPTAHSKSAPPEENQES